MAPRDDAAPARACPIETIARAYLVTMQGDAGLALRCAITDAVADLKVAS